MAKTSFRIFVLIICSTLLISCGKLNRVDISTTESGNTLIVTEEFSGVILTKEIMETLSPMIGGPEYWTPEVRQVLFLESKLGEYITQNASQFNSGSAPNAEELIQYVRQYYGVKYKEIVELRVIFSCPEFSKDADWQNQYVKVMGGGDCFFGVVYDLDTQDFVSFGVNSPK